MPKQSVHPEIDKHIGYRLKRLRQGRGMTQRELGERLRVKHQQIQKYEAGESRIAVSQLVEICRIFRVSLQHFVNGLPPALAPPEPPLRVIRVPDTTVFEDGVPFHHDDEDERDRRLASLEDLLGAIRRMTSEALDPAAPETP